MSTLVIGSGLVGISFGVALDSADLSISVRKVLDRSKGTYCYCSLCLTQKTTVVGARFVHHDSVHEKTVAGRNSVQGSQQCEED